VTDGPDYSKTSVGLTDADVRGAMLSSIRLLVVFAVVTALIFWWKSSWQSAVLVFVGAAISGASLWEWLRLMTAVNERMDAGKNPRPMGRVLVGFFARLGLTIVVLYVSLKYLNGTAFALAAGLGLGVLALTVEALRLLKRTTV
jgi:ATP synthase I subunit